jgi:cell division septation protein DedD
VKERLTGAAILVALIVLLVPELLRGPVRPVAPPVAASDEAAPLRSYTIKLGEDAHAHGAATPAASGPQQPAPLAANTESTPAPAEPAPAAAAEPVPAKPAPAKPTPVPAPIEHATAPPAPPPAAPADAASGAYMVQLGSFASRDNADRLAKQVRSQGFTVNVARGTTGRHLYKVLVGPAHDRAAATQLEAKLHAAGHTGSIVAK